MKVILVLASLFLAGTVFAQTANVIELSPADILRAHQAWDTLQTAQENWTAVRKSIGDKYTTRPNNTGGASTCTINEPSICYREGFMSGFEFSKDFRFIVPKAAEPRATRISSCIGIGCDVTW